MRTESSGFWAVQSAALTAVGWIALLLYILACRPSWSPDGSKLLFSYYDPHSDEAGVALLDRATGTTRKIFSRHKPSFEERHMQIQWDSYGRYAILRFELDKILLLPIDPSEPSRKLELPTGVEWTGWKAFPTAQIGGSLYLTGTIGESPYHTRKAVVRVDLETGKVTSRDADRAPLLYAGRNRIFYLATTENGHEVGEVDKNALTLGPLFELSDDDLERRGIDKLVGYAAVEPLGRRLALTGSSAHSTRIALCNESGIERIFSPQLSVEPYVLGSMEWSKARNTLYAAAFTPTGLEGITQLSVAEISLDGTPARLIPLGQMQDDLPGDDAETLLSLFSLQVSLSPDESKIAASTAHWNKDAIGAADRAVFIVDLEDPERPVTKVPLPSRSRLAGPNR